MMKVYIMRFIYIHMQLYYCITITWAKDTIPILLHPYKHGTYMYPNNIISLIDKYHHTTPHYRIIQYSFNIMRHILTHTNVAVNFFTETDDLRAVSRK